LTEEEGEALPAQTQMRSTRTFTEIFADTLTELAASHKDIVAITAAMPSGTGLTKFAELFPDRFYDVGISEDFAVVPSTQPFFKGLLTSSSMMSGFKKYRLSSLLTGLGWLAPMARPIKAFLMLATLGSSPTSWL